MQTYNILYVEETVFYENDSYTTEARPYPVDPDGNPVLDFLSKNRVIKNNQMIVFDSMSEYLDWMANNH
jgi:hypothetical protein